MDGKVCLKCDEVKPLDGFHRDATRRDGRSPYCKGCRAVEQAQYRVANREQLRDRNRRYYADNREPIRQKQREYTSANADRNRERASAWYAANPLRKAQYDAVYKLRRKIARHEKELAS